MLKIEIYAHPDLFSKLIETISEFGSFVIEVDDVKTISHETNSITNKRKDSLESRFCPKKKITVLCDTNDTVAQKIKNAVEKILKEDQGTIGAIVLSPVSYTHLTLPTKRIV